MQNKVKIFSLLIQLSRHLEKKHYQKLFLLLLLMFFSAITEVVSIGAVIPFLAVLTSPDILYSNNLLVPFLGFFDITSPEQLVLPSVIGFGLAAILAGSLRLILLWQLTRTSYNIGVDLGALAYRKTLYQPFEFHVSKNTSEIISGISIKTANLANSTILPIVNIISSFISLTAIMVLLFFIDPKVSIMSILGFGIIYTFIILYSNKKLSREGTKVNFEQNKIIKELQEGLGGIRDVLIEGSQEAHANIYYMSDLRLRTALGNIHILGTSPRYFVEAVGLVIVAAIAFWMMQQPRDAGYSFIILGAFAMGAQRLLPMIQQIYVGLTAIVGNSVVLNEVIKLLNQPITNEQNSGNNGTFKFENSIIFKNISFNYKSRDKNVIKNINFKINNGSKIGFIGDTGSGKSTVLDILMGLLKPKSGQILIDGIVLSDSNIRAWQSSLGHVPQSIYLRDASIADNIANNKHSEEIDLDRLRYVIKIAQLEDVIKSLPMGYLTIVGERGELLSGGQRQRIGIARALYKKPSLLILDEATNALDKKTELRLIKALKSLKTKITIIMVTHQVVNLKDCDKIIKIKDGEVERIGFYSEFE